MSVRRRAALKLGLAAGLAAVVPRALDSPALARTPPGAQPAGTVAGERLTFRHASAQGDESWRLVSRELDRSWTAHRGESFDLGWGDYRLTLYDARRETLLFRTRFDSPLDLAQRSSAVELTVRCPALPASVYAQLEKWRAPRAFRTLSEGPLDRRSRSSRTSIADAADVLRLSVTGAPQAKVNLAILGDGYTAAEKPKFAADAARALNYLYAVEPFAHRRNDFNAHAVFVPSAESGVTDGYLSVARKTAFGCAYYAGGSERTIAAMNERALRDAASVVPYDFMLVLANARRYGGSAYFGGPAAVAIDSAFARYLVLHELAHAIGALAEEYYIPDAYGPTYTGNVEPWSPNVTISRSTAKWRTDGASERSSPWNKTEYDRFFARYVADYQRLRGRHVDESTVERLMTDAARRQRELLRGEPELRRPGCYEGAHGYGRGAYRSEVDCIMFSLQTDYFCTACSAALERMIDRLCA